MFLEDSWGRGQGGEGQHEGYSRAPQHRVRLRELAEGIGAFSEDNPSALMVVPGDGSRRLAVQDVLKARRRLSEPSFGRRDVCESGCCLEVAPTWPLTSTRVPALAGIFLCLPLIVD